MIHPRTHCAIPDRSSKLPARAPRRAPERGQILVIFALALVAMLAMGGLLIDGGMAWGNERQGQTAADTAALNAAKAFAAQPVGTSFAVRNFKATQAAWAMAARNGFPSGTVSCPGGTPVQGVIVNNPPLNNTNPAHNTGDYIEVITTRPMKTTFSGVVGQSCWLVSARAVASVVSASTTVTVPYPAILAALGPNPCDDGAFHNSGSNVTIVGDLVSNSGMWGPYSGWTQIGTSTQMAKPPNPCGSRDSGPPGTTTVTTAATFPVTYSYCYPGAPAADCVGHANWTLTNNNTGVTQACTYKAGSGSNDFDTGNFASLGPGMYCSSGGITVSSATPPPVDIAGVAYGNGQWVAVGASGALETSTDGINWTLRTSGFGTTDIAEVGYGNGLWVAVGASGKLATSTNGTTWTLRTSGFGATNIAGVAYGGGQWVIVGASGKLATSTDGIAWTLRLAGGAGTTFNNSNIDGVAYNGSNLWTAVADAGKLATSTDGITWTLRLAGGAGTTFTTSNINGIAYNGSNLWTAVADAGKVATSTDGITWTLVGTSSFGTTNISGVAYNGSNLWAAVGAAGKLATSPDGTTWTPRTSSFGTTDIKGVGYGNGLWVAAGLAGELATSPDGITWTQRATDFGPTRITFVAAGLIRISAANVNLAPFWDNLAAFSTLGGATTEAINFSGGAGNWSGVMYTPNGQVHFSGADNTTYSGAMWGQTVHTSGMNWTLSSSGLGTTGSGPSEYKIGNLVE